MSEYNKKIVEIRQSERKKDGERLGFAILVIITLLILLIFYAMV